MTSDQQLTIGDIAARLKIAESTWRAYLAPRTRHDGAVDPPLAPPPDGRLGRTPWWYAKTIDEWQAQRKGQGWRKGVRGEVTGKS